MGLRERNAAKTREAILDAALTLFQDQGFDATRMEEIADQAEVSPSTLYRYFATKDQLISQPFALNGQMAAELRARPIDEPLDLALGHALTSLLTTPRLSMDRLRQVRVVLDASPGLHARILEDFVRERTLLQQAVADRLGRPTDDLFCTVTAWLTTTILELVGTANSSSTADNVEAIAEALELTRTISDRLRAEPPVVPRLGAAQPGHAHPVSRL